MIGRRLRSFVTRAGRISVAQQRALDQLLPVFGIPYRAETLDFVATFDRDAMTVLEIGFGMGETTAHLAQTRPDVNFFGIEVHTPGVGALLKQVAQHSLTNLRIIQHDAVDVLEHMIAPGSLAGIHVFFSGSLAQGASPEKTPAARPARVAMLADRLKDGGYLHCATDWENYAEQMQGSSVLRAHPQSAVIASVARESDCNASDHQIRDARLASGPRGLGFHCHARCPLGAVANNSQS